MPTGMRIIQVSDTHISASHQLFADNNQAVHNWLAAQRADLIVHTGDLAMDGAAEPADLKAAAAWNSGVDAPVFCVPGNHDVGDTAAIKADQQVDDGRLAIWRGLIGPDRWWVDQAGWRLIGVNAMLLGTGHAEEEEQFYWLENAVQTDAPIAMFLHKPLFIARPDEPPRGYWTVLPTPRQRVLRILRGARVRLIASGHLHIQRHMHLDGIDHVWGPAASFVCGASQENLGGLRHLGAVIHDFEADRVVSRFVRPDGLEDRTIEPVQHILYPKPDRV